ncbi:aminoglycoside 6-adenylyltransferase [Candidatus Enterococcus willemsii]|uniref:Polymerase nucleotidyl transferase domain-containing protein n=1 Tax=Candidatus Enterococcus willemsii TaxID=1857215 RepID=A0ABQ6YW62_9ENTE|nr:nucleotidyltransferase domain-containing protein [Enterococcus sp. CU12B]KAF1301908.1 hypothetical protein BAU17_00635 [Enterococcus sp. CU12B]
MYRTHLNSARQLLLDQILSLTQDNPTIEGIFLGGSLATGTTDCYSDIDFRIVITSPLQKSNFLQSLLNQLDAILFIETQTDFYAVVHFETFIKLDIFIYTWKDLAPNPWLADIAILKDTANQLLDIKEDSQRVTYVPSQEKFTYFMTKYYAYLHEYYRRYRRKEGHYALSCQLTLKHILVSFWYMQQQYLPNSLGDWSKYEGTRTKLSSAQLNQLNELSQLEGTAFITTMTSLIRDISQKISQEFPISFNISQFNKITALVEKEK